jgi:hypothetical protein
MGNVRQQDMVLDLCKMNDFQYGDVWFHLRKTIPPSFQLRDGGCTMMEKTKNSLCDWDMGCIIAIDATVTTNNKAIGFVLYHIHRETKNQLEVLFLLVSETYRNKNHATNMVKMLEDRHLFKFNAVTEDMSRAMSQFVSVMKKHAGDSYIINEIGQISLDDFKNGEKMDIPPFSTFGKDLVYFFGAKVQSTSMAVEFWRKLGYEDLSKLQGWRDVVIRTSAVDHIYMIRAGPRTCHEVHNGRYPWVG